MSPRAPLPVGVCDEIGLFIAECGFGAFSRQAVTLGYLDNTVGGAQVTQISTDIHERTNRHGTFEVSSQKIGAAFDMTYEELSARRCLSTVSFSLNALIEPTVKEPNSVFAADMDGDGDSDVLFSSSGDRKTGWFENVDGLGSFAKQQLISSDADLPVSAADMDGDGDLDVITGSSAKNTLVWHENLNGRGDFSQEHVISQPTAGVTSIFSMDIDSDGDVDVLFNSAGNTVWSEIAQP